MKVFAAALLLLPALAAPAGAVDFVVDAFVDAPDANPGNGDCDDGSGQCTLRAAVMEANALGGADTIELPAGTFALTLGDNGPDDAAGGDLDVTGPLTISGAGSAASVVDAKRAKSRAFDTFDDLTLIDLAVIGGKPSTKAIDTLNNVGSGGCILSRGDLVLERVLVAGCSAAVDGGGVFQLVSTLTAIDSTFAQNKAKRDGGGAKLFASTSTVERSLFLDNSAKGEGGGMAIEGGSSDVVNTTFSRNSGKAEGGGVQAEQGANLELIHVTFADNGSKRGAAIHVNDTLDPPTTTAANSIFHTKKKRGAGNCQQSLATMITSLGGNVDNGTSCSFGQPTDASGVDPLLAPLDDNGGETLTHALDPASPALARGAANCEPEDQRGTARATPCDSGAFEAP